MKFRHGWIAIAALSILVGACDDQSSPPPPVVTAPKATGSAETDSPKPPTTQELLAQPLKSITLHTLPLTARVPESWDIEKLTPEVVFLSGPAPSDRVQIQLTSQPDMTRRAVDRLKEGAVKEAQGNGQSGAKAELREMDGYLILERHSLGIELEVLDSSGNVVGKSPSHRWTLTYLIPYGTEKGEEQRYRVFQLNFIGLTQKQFEADESFLKRIVDSVSVDHTAAI